jgi:LysR family transcriptional regulator, transcriptional activator of the cysJI operon
MYPDFNRLHLFYQVFRNASVVKAAQKLFVTQSAVSQNLQKLEQELNVSLFHRFPKRLIPTTAGEQLYQSILPFFSSIDTVIQSIHSADEQAQGVVRIGAPPVFGAEYLPHIISEFRKKYPLVKVVLMLADQRSIVDAYRSSELDIALVDIFGNKEEDSWNMIQDPLVDEPLALIGTSEYVNTNLPSGPQMQAMQRCQFIAYKQHAPELHDWFINNFGEDVRELDIVLTVESVHAVINAVRCSMGFGIVPLYLVQTFLKTKELVSVSVGKNSVRSRISLLRLTGRKPGVVERLFVDALKGAFSRL